MPRRVGGPRRFIPSSISPLRTVASLALILFGGQSPLLVSPTGYVAVAMASARHLAPAFTRLASRRGVSGSSGAGRRVRAEPALPRNLAAAWGGTNPFALPERGIRRPQSRLLATVEEAEKSPRHPQNVALDLEGEPMTRTSVRSYKKYRLVEELTALGERTSEPISVEGTKADLVKRLIEKAGLPKRAGTAAAASISGNDGAGIAPAAEAKRGVPGGTVPLAGVSTTEASGSSLRKDEGGSSGSLPSAVAPNQSETPSSGLVAPPSIDPDRKYVLYFDGGSRGNPGLAGSGMVLYDEDEKTEVWAGRHYLGNDKTNNYAEYTGLLTGLNCANKLGIKRLVVRGDSLLVVKQVRGEWKVKNPSLKPLFESVKKVARQFEEIEIFHIRREDNKRADELANEAQDWRSSFGLDMIAAGVGLDAENVSRDYESQDADRDEPGGRSSPDAPIQTETPSGLAPSIDPDRKYVLYFDGGSRGNPGLAGSGMVLYDEDEKPEVWAGRHYLGNDKTNNYAEYTGLLTGLKCALKLGVKRLVVRGDSLLVVKQVRGEWKVKNLSLKPLFESVKQLARQFEEIEIFHVRREDNKRADELANEAQDWKSSFGLDVVAPVADSNVENVSGEIHQDEPARNVQDTDRAESEKEETGERPVTNMSPTTTNGVKTFVSPTVLKETANLVPTSASGPIIPGRHYVLRFGGGSHGNPGVTGAGFVLYDAEYKKEVWSGYNFVGEFECHNVAEYVALIAGLRGALALGVTKLSVQGNSALVIGHLRGDLKAKSENIKPFYLKALELCNKFDSCQQKYIELRFNARSVELAKHAMDQKDSFGFEPGGLTVSS